MKKLAEAILDAIEIREESYNQKAANKEAKMVDFNKFYKKSLMEAADEAAGNAGFDISMTFPIYLLIQNNWNEIQSWAIDRVMAINHKNDNGIIV